MNSPTPSGETARKDAQVRDSTPCEDAEARDRLSRDHTQMRATAQQDFESYASPSNGMSDATARDDADLRAAGYTLTVEQVMQRLDVEGVAKSRRTVQQYMKDGQIDSRLVQVGPTKRRLANELDMARFIEELKRREALALLTKGHVEPTERETVSEVAPDMSAAIQPDALEMARLQERVDQLELRLADSKSQTDDLRDQLKAAHEQVSHWAENARDLKQLLSAQTDMNAPVLAALAKNLNAQAEREGEKGVSGSAIDLT